LKDFTRAKYNTRWREKLVRPTTFSQSKHTTRLIPGKATISPLQS